MERQKQNSVGFLGTKWLEPKWREPQRIDQVLTKSLRDRMRPENLRFIFVCANLHHQKPVGCSPFIPFSTDCTPPAAVLLSSRYPPKTFLQRKTVAMQADVRRCNSSTSTNWRNDSPQEVRAFSQYFPYMPNRPASSFTTFSLPSHDERQNPATSHRVFTSIDGAIFVRTAEWPFQKATFHRPRSVTYRCDFKHKVVTDTTGNRDQYRYFHHTHMTMMTREKSAPTSWSGLRGGPPSPLAIFRVHHCLCVEHDEKGPNPQNVRPTSKWTLVR